jgi:hypothetical protein
MKEKFKTKIKDVAQSFMALKSMPPRSPEIPSVLPII